MKMNTRMLVRMILYVSIPDLDLSTTLFYNHSWHFLGGFTALVNSFK